MPRAKAAPKHADDSDDAPLKRLGGGRWQTRDERFTIEPQSGTWVVVDAEQTDDFGMALVRGPYRSLTEAKAAIAAARSSAPAASPLAERIDRRRSAPKLERDAEPDAKAAPERKARGVTPAQAAKSKSKPESKPKPEAPRPSKDAEPEEPAWLTDLEPAERGRARRLIARLEEAGIDDATAVVRRDILGDVPAVASIAIARRLADLPGDTTPAKVAELLADGRDERLDVRWRLVDGEGRPIVIEAKRLLRR